MTMGLSSEAALLLADAERVEAACDLERELPASGARLVASLGELFGGAELPQLSARALWNLLWLAADLSTRLDVYRAAELLAAVERLFTRHLQRALTERDERSEAAEMAYDFFFNRPAGEQPLVSLRLPETLASLERVLELDNRFCRRAALHGLGHLRQHVAAPTRQRIDTLLDALPDPSLRAYVALVRAEGDGLP